MEIHKKINEGGQKIIDTMGVDVEDFLEEVENPTKEDKQDVINAINYVGEQNESMVEDEIRTFLSGIEYQKLNKNE